MEPWLLQLPVDLKLSIFAFCHASDVLRVQRVCKPLHRFVLDNRRHLPLVSADLEVVLDPGTEAWTFDLSLRTARSASGAGRNGGERESWERIESRNSLELVVKQRRMEHFPDGRTTRRVSGVFPHQLPLLTRELRSLHLHQLGIFFSPDDQHRYLMPVQMLLLFAEHFRQLHYSPEALAIGGGNFAQISLNDWMVFLCAVSCQGMGIRRIRLRGTLWPSYDFLLPAVSSSGCLSHTLQSYEESWPSAFASAEHPRVEDLHAFIAGHLRAQYAIGEGRRGFVREIALAQPCQVAAEVWIEMFQLWQHRSPSHRSPRLHRLLHLSVDLSGRFTHMQNLVSAICARFDEIGGYADSLMLVKADKAEMLYCDFDQEKFHVKLYALPSRGGDEFAPGGCKLEKAFRDMRWWTIRAAREAERVAAVRQRLAGVGVLPQLQPQM